MAKQSVNTLFEALPDIPQSLGDLIGKSFRVFRRRFKSIISILLWPTLVSTLCIAGLRFSLMHWMSMHTLDLVVYVWHAGAALVLIGLLAGAQWELSIRALALIRNCLGVDHSYAQSYAYARSRKWAAFLLYNVAVLLPLLVFLFWMVCVWAYFLLMKGHELMRMFSPVVVSLDGFLLTVTFCWCLLFPSIAFCVLACEGVPLKAVWFRTFELGGPYLWRGGSFVALLIVSLAVVVIALGLPVIAVNAVDYGAHGFSTIRLTADIPIYIQVLGGISDAVTNLVLAGVAIIADAMFYNDLRMRVEGRDIILKLADLSR